MSAPIAGKFQDHYTTLGIDPKSDSEMIQRAYADLAQRYHPNNIATGSLAMFEAVNLAYEVLCDPEQRSAFDKLVGVGQVVSTPKFTGVDFFDALGREALLRAAILCVLYDRRLTEPSYPSLSIRHLELIVEATPVRLNSALWYLKQRGLAASDDKSSLQITVDGMDFLENAKPLPEDVMPFIKPAAIAIRESQSALTTLNRALAEIRR